MRRVIARRWADQIIRDYASQALKGAGFNTAARALATAPELDDEEDNYRDVRARVEAALNTVLAAREVPAVEPALHATLAAKEALEVVKVEHPTSRHLTAMVHAIHLARAA
jgi:hypothetical protein